MWRSGQITLQRLQSSIGNLRKQAADVWCRERAVINSRHVDPPPHSPCHFISRTLIPYTAQMKWLCIKGRPEAVDRLPRAGGWSDRTSCRDKAPLSISVHAAAEPSRLITYDNATVGAAAMRQLHKRALVAALPPAAVFLGTSQRSSFLRALSSFSHGTCRGGVSASILFSGGRRCRRYIEQSKPLSKRIVLVAYQPIFFCIESNRIVSAARCIVRSLVYHCV